MTIQTVNNYVLIDPIYPEQTTESGIVLADSKQNGTNRGLVLKCSDDSLVTEGQEVLFRAYSSSIEPVKMDGKEHILVPESDILAIVAS